MSSRSTTSPEAKGRGLKDEGTRLQVVAAGAISGLVSRFVIAPLDVIKIRLQLQSYHSGTTTPTTLPPRGIAATARHILVTEGLTAFWKGNVPAELLYVCYSAAQFTAYRSTTILLRDPSLPALPPAAESFVAGAVAGVAGIASTYPLDLLRTRFAAQGNSRVYSSLRLAVAHIYRDEGMRGFFRGLGPTVGQMAPYMGVFFAAYEAARPVCAQLSRLPFGGSDAAAGVIAGVVAKTAVFPLDLVKKRIQVQGPTRLRYVYGDALPEYTAGALRALVSIFSAEGVRGLYRGLAISLLKAAPASAVIVWTYERSLAVLVKMEDPVEYFA